MTESATHNEKIDNWYVPSDEFELGEGFIAKVYKCNGHDVLVYIDRDDIPWIRGADLFRVLGYEYPELHTETLLIYEHRSFKMQGKKKIIYSKFINEKLLPDLLDFGTKPFPVYCAKFKEWSQRVMFPNIQAIIQNSKEGLV